MCGIIGYVGHQQAAPILLDGLARMEYRGYDSAGAVSYTHLDVYKRQVDTGVGAGLALIAAGIIEEHQVAGLQFGNAVDLGAHAAEPLAGSGVDVYKRQAEIS